MCPTRRDPLRALFRLQRALESPRYGEWLGRSTGGRGVFPPLNVFQDGDDHVVVAEVPGLDRDSLTVEIHRNRLRIAGERSAEVDEGVSVHRRERRAGAFDRTVTLPVEIDRDAAEASYENGILKVRLSPRPETKPRTLEIG